MTFARHLLPCELNLLKKEPNCPQYLIAPTYPPSRIQSPDSRHSPTRVTDTVGARYAAVDRVATRRRSGSTRRLRAAPLMAAAAPGSARVSPLPIGDTCTQTAPVPTPAGDASASQASGVRWAMDGGGGRGFRTGDGKWTGW